MIGIRRAALCAVLSALVLPGSAAAWQESAYSQLNQRIAGAPDGTVVYAQGAGFSECGCTRLVIVRPDDSRKEITWRTPDANIPFVAVNNKVITVAWDTGNQENARVFTRTFKLDGTAIGANTRVTPPREGPKNYFAVVGLAAAGGRTVLLTSTFLVLTPQPLHSSVRRGSRAFSRARPIEGARDADEVERRFSVLPDGSALVVPFENRTIMRLPPDSTVWRKYKGRDANTNATLHAADDGSWALGGYTDSGSQLRTGRAGRRLTTFPPQYEGDAYFVERIAVALPGSRGAYVSSGAQDGQDPSEFLRMQIARPAAEGGTTQEVVYVDNVGELYDAEASSTRQIAALTQWAPDTALAEEVHLVLRNRDGRTSVTNLGPEESEPARQFHLLRAGGRIVVVRVEEPGTIEIFRLPG
jgi:hypothetical protein